MTPEQQRIAIGLACGYSQCPCGVSLCIGVRNMPDYLNDRNAMAAAVETLGIDAEDYAHRLWMMLCFGRSMSDRRAMLTLSEATASQRAEAFLRIIGKWQEP